MIQNKIKVPELHIKELENSPTITINTSTNIIYATIIKFFAQVHSIQGQVETEESLQDLGVQEGTQGLMSLVVEDQCHKKKKFVVIVDVNNEE